MVVDATAGHNGHNSADGSIASRLRRLHHALNHQEQVPGFDTFGAFGLFGDIAKEMYSSRVEGGFAGYKEFLTATYSRTDPLFGQLRNIILTQGTEAEESTQEANVQNEATQDEEEIADKRLLKTANNKLIFRTLSEDDIDNLPTPECLVAGFLLEVAVSLFFGDSNVGKTFLLLHLAQCIARGVPFFGKEVKQGKVLYIYAEGGNSLKLRLQAWRQHYRKDKTSDIDYIALPVHLIADREYLLNTIEALYSGESPALVVIDTFSACSAGIDQKEQKEVHLALSTAREICSTYHCHVSIIHHTNKQDQFNGAKEFKNDVDHMIKLVESTDKHVLIESEKQRDLAPFQPFKLELLTIDLGVDEKTLEALSSCVLVFANVSDAGVSIPKMAAQLLNTLESLGGQALSSKWEDKGKELYGIGHTSYHTHKEYLVSRELVQPPDNKKRDQALYMLTEKGEQYLVNHTD